MFKHYFEQIHGIEVWPIVSLSIFFVFFVCLILWVLSVNKDYVEQMSNLPVDDLNEKKDNHLKPLNPSL